MTASEPSITMIRSAASLSLLAALAALSSAQSFANVFSEGHTDGLAVDRNAADAHKFDFFTKHDNPDTGEEEEYDSNTVLLQAVPLTLTSRPAGSQFDFIGVAAGSPFYWLPQTQFGDPVLDLGTAAEDLTSSQFGAWDPDGAGYNGVNKAVGRWVKFTLQGVTGLNGGAALGTISAWSGDNNGTGTPGLSQKLFSTLDGLDATDAIIIGVGGHVHYNWGMSAPGYYRTTWIAESRLADGTTITSLPTSVTFLAGAQPVPEPAPLAALGLGALALWRRRRSA